ncbi:amidohydrolase family protein [Streptosporangium sp. NPDC051022]|uniref:amidohydrolase family protein n=1 Tax=Streptosporangium sp. NPDC051022 TaxID=3155752 RepID=UPI003431D206
MTQADLIVCGSAVVTMNAEREILLDGGVAVRKDLIVAVGPARELRERWPHAPVLERPDSIVTPGLINVHQHLTGDPLLRSCIPDRLPPGASIRDWSLPLHAAHTPEHDEVAATVGALDCLRNGVTTVIEAGTVAHPARAAAGMHAAGVRGSVGTWGWDVPGVPFSADVPEVLARQRDVLERFPAGGRVEGWVTLVGHDLASDALLTAAADLARDSGARMTMHLSPSAADPAAYLRRVGRRPAVHLDRLGVLGPHLLLGHAVWLDDEELDALAGSGTSVAYCPWAYLRLGQGVTVAGRHAEMCARGIPIGLGGDSANAGDHSDMLKAAALAAGLVRDTRTDPQVFGAHDAFEWATVTGAVAAGMGGRIGSLEPGKLADLVVHDAGRSGWPPAVDPVLALVWGGDGRTVRDVVVGGEPVLREGRSTRIDEPELQERARRVAADTLAAAGIVVPSRWPLRR